MIILAIIGNFLASVWYSLGQQRDVNVGNGKTVNGWIGTLEKVGTIQDPTTETLYIHLLYSSLTVYLGTLQVYIGHLRLYQHLDMVTLWVRRQVNTYTPCLSR